MGLRESLRNFKFFLQNEGPMCFSACIKFSPTGTLALQRPPLGPSQAASVIPILPSAPRLPSGIPFPFLQEVGVLRRVLIPGPPPPGSANSVPRKGPWGWRGHGASPSPALWGFRKLRSASEPAEPYLLPVILGGGEEPYSQ